MRNREQQEEINYLLLPTGDKKLLKTELKDDSPGR